MPIKIGVPPTLKVLEKTGATDATSVTGAGSFHLEVSAGSVSVSVDGGTAVTVDTTTSLYIGTFTKSLSVTPGTGATYSIVVVYQ